MDPDKIWYKMIPEIDGEHKMQVSYGDGIRFRKRGS